MSPTNAVVAVSAMLIVGGVVAASLNGRKAPKAEAKKEWCIYILNGRDGKSYRMGFEKPQQKAGWMQSPDGLIMFRVAGSDGFRVEPCRRG